ncbi:MAG: hypothetical protein LBF59_05560 [Prevotellaceae bacterium]|jgi:hypothetical protein|nr:hypothetical protein [Prevotellaceae bacterium]
MKNEKPIKRYFKLMADYGNAWGWEINHYIDGTSDEICIAVYDEDDFDGIKIPIELAKRIDEWQQEFEMTGPFEHNEGFDWDDFSKRGIRLAIELKKHIGHLFDAFYYVIPFEDDLNSDISHYIEIQIK